MAREILIDDVDFDFVCQLLKRLSVKHEIKHFREEEIERKKISEKVSKFFEKIEATPYILPKGELNKKKRKKNRKSMIIKSNFII